VTGNQKHYVYCHFTTDSSAPFYVGIGTHSSKYRNYARAKSKSGRNYFWKQLTKSKYIITICSESDDYEEIKEMEKEFIDLVGIENLTNLTLGGEGTKGYKHTEEHIKKLKENYANGKSSLSNRKITENEKLLKRLQYSGSGNPNYNKRGFLSKTGKITLKLDVEGNIVSEYGSSRDAAISHNVKAPSIRKAIRQGTMSVGFFWKYK
jgi:hypothetical protein